MKQVFLFLQERTPSAMRCIKYHRGQDLLLQVFVSIADWNLLYTLIFNPLQ